METYHVAMVRAAEEPFWSALGMTASDARVYEHLLAHGASTEQAVSDATSLPLPTVLSGTEKLLELGLVASSSRGWTTTRPSSTLLHVVRERRAALSAGADIVSALDRLWGAGAAGSDSSEIFETLHGAPRIGERLLELMRFAKETVDVIDAAPYVSAPSPQMKEEEHNGQRRGVSFRVLVDSAALADDEHRADIARSVHENQEIRVATGLTTKLVLIDRKHVMLPLDLQFSEPRAAVVSQPELVRVLSDYFEVAFAQGSPLLPPKGAMGLESAEAQLVQLLSAGVPDAIIARDMNVSERTLRRRISDLQDRYRVDTRFQLGRALERSIGEAMPESARSAAQAE